MRDRNWWKPCEKCKRQIAHNWMKRHVESGCVSGTTPHPRKTIDTQGKETINPTKEYFPKEED